jgi:excisionase family DNA binding protein
MAVPGIRTMSNQNLLTVADLADYLRVSVNTIYQWNYKGTGPKPIPVGKYVRYRRTDVERWLADQGR